MHPALSLAVLAAGPTASLVFAAALTTATPSPG